MKSLGQTTRGAASGVKDTVNEYKGWLILGLAGYVVYKFNGVFTSLSDTAKAGVEAATAEAKAKAEASAEATKVKATAAVDKAKVSALAPAATAADVAQYRADAEQIASLLGTTKGQFTMNWLWSKDAQAFTLLKTKYSRLLLSNNKPYDVNTRQTQTVETKTSAKRKINASVLQPFYSEITGGRNLVSDIKSACSSSTYQPVLRWVL